MYTRPLILAPKRPSNHARILCNGMGDHRKSEAATNIHTARRILSENDGLGSIRKRDSDLKIMLDRASFNPDSAISRQSFAPAFPDSVATLFSTLGFAITRAVSLGYPLYASFTLFPFTCKISLPPHRMVSARTDRPYFPFFVDPSFSAHFKPLKRRPQMVLDTEGPMPPSFVV